VTAADQRIRDVLKEPKLAALLDVLNADGEETRVVGGAVRNLLLGEAVNDVDLASTAWPETVSKRAAAAGWKVVPTGIEHGTVTVVIDGTAFEVTTLRADIATDGRHAEVAFTRDFAVDAARRDFTINALSLGPDGRVHDYGDGLADIAQRRVRFFGQPERRIQEDYLRILRFYRFSARYGSGGIDGEGRAACRALHDGMAILSAERLGAEMLKLLAPEARASLEALHAMQEDGVLGTVLSAPSHLHDLVALEKAERAYDVPRAALRWLMALAVRSETDTEHLTARLRLSRRARERLSLPLTIGAVAPSQTAIDPLIYRYGGEAVTDLALLNIARGLWQGTAWRLFVEKAVRRAEGWQPPVFPIKAKDMVERGMVAGPALGEALRHAEQLWLDHGLPNDRKKLDWIVEQVVSRSG
jgi:poly(A) polymerase